MREFPPPSENDFAAGESEEKFAATILQPWKPSERGAGAKCTEHSRRGEGTLGVLDFTTEAGSKPMSEFARFLLEEDCAGECGGRRQNPAAWAP